MQEQDPLAQLRDIHLPEAISVWPPAPGWWVLFIGIIALLATLAYYWRNHTGTAKPRRLSTTNKSIT